MITPDQNGLRNSAGDNGNEEDGYIASTLNLGSQTARGHKSKKVVDGQDEVDENLTIIDTD